MEMPNKNGVYDILNHMVRQRSLGIINRTGPLSGRIKNQLDTLFKIVYFECNVTDSRAAWLTRPLLNYILNAISIACERGRPILVRFSIAGERGSGQGIAYT